MLRLTRDAQATYQVALEGIIEEKEDLHRGSSVLYRINGDGGLADTISLWSILPLLQTSFLWVTGAQNGAISISMTDSHVLTVMYIDMSASLATGS